MDTTEHDLRLLSIGYFIQGGVVSFYALLGLVYTLFMGAIFTAMLKNAPANPHRQIPPQLLPILGIVFTFLLLIVVAGAVCLIVAGVSLRSHRHRTFVFVMGVLSCLAVPYGTVLGIFTIIVLQRPSARALFGLTPLQPPPLPQQL